MANAYRNADLSLAIYRPLRTARVSIYRKNRQFILVLHKCNIWLYFLLLLTQVDFFGTTFYFLKSRIFGMYFYFLESSKVIYFGQHCLLTFHWFCARVLHQQKSSVVESLSSTSKSSSSSSSDVNGVRTRRVRFNDGHLTTTTSSYCCNVSASSSCSSCSSHSGPVDSVAPQSHVRQLISIHCFISLNL